MLLHRNLRDEFKAQAEANPNKYGYPNHEEIAYELGAKQVHYEILDELRWGHLVEYVYERRGKYVSIVYSVGSGDSEYDYEPVYTEVKPVEVTTVKYERDVAESDDK